MTNIRKQTCIVIRKNKRYLVGKEMLQPKLKWSWSKYEAWRTREKKDAAKVARITGGIMVLFNPVTGQEKIIGG